MVAHEHRNNVMFQQGENAFGARDLFLHRPKNAGG